MHAVEPDTARLRRRHVPQAGGQACGGGVQLGGKPVVLLLAWEPNQEHMRAGAMYHRLAGTPADGEYNRVASLWFCAMVALFQSGNNALTIAYGQKALLRREAQVPLNPGFGDSIP